MLEMKYNISTLNKNKSARCEDCVTEENYTFLER